jgi:hypothetical protein
MMQTGNLLTRKNSYETAQPHSYRVGDIVEIQMTIIGVPLKGRKFKMLTVLRSIALLDSSFTQVKTKPYDHKDNSDQLEQDAAKRRAASLRLKEVEFKTLKRSIRYEDKTKEARARMELDTVD